MNTSHLHSRNSRKLFSKTGKLAFFSILILSAIGGYAVSASSSANTFRWLQLVNQVKQSLNFGESTPVRIATLSSAAKNPVAPATVIMVAGKSISSFGTAVTENFNGLLNTPATGNAWTDDTTIDGVFATPTTYNAGTGSSNTGALYSFGAASNTERALGGVASGGTGTIYYAVRFKNNTGGRIGGLTISYTGEQWRDGGSNGGTPAAQTINFQYQVANASVITDANTPSTGWTTFSSLSFTSPIFTNNASGAALDGNLAANRTAKSATLLFPAGVANGQEIFLRWEDLNDAGNDHGLAIDDLSVTAFSQPTIIASGPVTRQQGAAASNSTVATGVSDVSVGTLTVTATTVPTGITVTNIVNSGGTVTADVAADCTATTGANTVVLTVTNGTTSATNTANLTVNVDPNTPPVLTYNSANVITGTTGTINPATGPSDNVSVASIVLQSVSPATTPGTLTVDNTTGVVTVPNNVPAGTYTVTIRATDNCGGANGTTDAMFTLTVNAPPTLGNYPNTMVQAGANTTVTPSAAPTNVTSVTATAIGFQGSFTVNPTTGVVRVTNAGPAGSYTVTISGFGAGGSATKTFTLTVTNPIACNSVTFTSPTTPEVGVGGNPRSVAAGDFNGDGKLDFVVANFNSNNISIRLGDGAGGFTSPATPEVGVGSGPLSVAVGDFNGDGKLDFVVANASADNVSIRLGDGAGGFTSPTTPEVTVGSTPRIAVGDVNGDGKLDFVTANSNSSNISIRLGDGVGGFTSPATPEVGVGGKPLSVAVGDFNGDGKPDFVAANNNNNISIRLGDGTGGFTSPTTPEVTVGTRPSSVVVGDVNGDGKLDFIAANQLSDNVSIRVGDGAGGFTSPATSEVSVGDHPLSVAIGDVNGDGKLDFIAANFVPAAVSIRLGDGAGGFNNPATSEISVGSGPISVAVGDVNGDGKLDFIATNDNDGTASIRLNNCTFNTPPTITAGGPLTRQQGTAASNSTIATVSDMSAGPLTVTATTVPTGISVTNISNSSGTVTADVAADCVAATGANTVVLTVTNATTGLTNTANLTVNVDPNTPPVLTYDDANVITGTTGTINPATGPSDNGSLASIVLQSVTPATAPGTITVNNTTGVVTVPNNVPAGSYTVTIRATDTCGGVNGTTDATFTLTVACPTTFTVDDTLDTADANPGDGVCGDIDSICTLRAAIMEANALAATACASLTIDFSVTGTIDLNSVLPILNHPNLTISGPGASQLTVRRNAGGNYRIFEVNTARTAAISGLTIQEGNSPTGGGILNGGTLTLTGVTVTNNTSTGSGGGIYSIGPLTLNGVAITNNTVTGIGGGIYSNNGSLTITNSTISNNNNNGGNSTTTIGGGIYASLGTVTITGSTISGNANSNPLSILQGAAMNLQDTTTTITNSTISGHTGTNNRNVLYNLSGSNNSTMTLVNVTVTANHAANTATVDTAGGSFPATTYLRNTLVADNTGRPNFRIVSATLTSLGNNLDSDGSSTFTNGANGDLVGTSGNKINPLLAVLGNYGGTTLTHALLPGSPAINAGDNCVLTNSCASNNLGFNLPNDQRGKARVGNVDIGAFESQGFVLALSGGSPQTAQVNASFANPLAVTVTANNTADNEPVNDGQVTFTPPGSGASATIAGSPATISSGVATTGTVTANNTVGGPYNVAASAIGGNTVNFMLTNMGVPDLTISKTTASIFQQGGTASYTLTVTNSGNGPTTAIFTVSDMMPTGLTIASTPVAAGFDCSASTSSALSCVSTSALAASATRSITLPVNIAANAPASITNTATVSGGGESVTNNNTGSVTVNVTAQSGVLINVPAGISYTFNGQTVTGSQTFQLAPGTYTLSTTTPQSLGAGVRAVFSSWSDTGAISHSVTVGSAPLTITGNFTTQYELTTAANPANGGTVTPVTGTFFDAGTVVNVAAVSNSGFNFSNWTGPVASSNSAATTVTMDAAKSVTANFFTCPSNFTVNNLGDTADAIPGNGVCADGSGNCTLRAAIEEANAVTACSPLTINFSVTGTISLATALPALDHPNLTINGPGASQLTVQRSTAGGTPDFRLLAINSGKTVNLSGLTLTNGKTAAGQDGGAILNTGTLGLAEMVISGNNAAQAGGAIANFGNLTITLSTIVGNTAAFDAGILTVFGQAIISTSTISGNMATSGQSGALKNQDGIVTLTNCTISGNNSLAFVNLANNGKTASLTLTNCTVTDGGLLNVDNGGATSAVINLKNTIVSHSSTTLDVAGANASIVSQGNNLTNDGGGGFLTGTGDLINVNPLLAALGNYGGMTQTHALLPGSPAINAGTSTGTPTADQRGQSRFGATDIGAFESQGFVLAASGGTPQTTLLNTAFASPLTLTVTANNTADNEPVNGGQITFTPPGSGASAVLTTSPATIASGAASVTAAANGTAGSYNVTATANGATPTVNFALTNNVAPTVTQLVRGNASPTNSGSVTFNVGFSEPVTSATASNFMLVPGGSVTGALITNVVCNMGAQSCVITVNTGTGSGTLGLNMTNSTGVTDGDGAGLSNLPFTGGVYTLDKDAPDTTIANNPANPTNSTSATFTFTGNDGSGVGVASFECKLDSGNFTACTSPQNYGSLADGSHTFQVRATDNVGNVDPTPASYTWVVDTVGPTVTINQAAGQADPTSSSPINFTVVFNEAVTGFGNSTADVTLSGTAGATTAVVTGGPTTYNVAVSGMTANGDVIVNIPAGAAQDAATNPNAASTSTDNKVTFTLFACPTVFTVNDLGDTPDANVGDGQCKDAANKCTLRAAIMEANSTAVQACAPLTINFSVTGAINLATELPALTHPNLTIQGPGASQLTVQRSFASGTPAFRVFTAQSGTVSISGLTITNGGGNVYGGGILATTDLTLDGCVVTGNNAVGAFAGGIGWIGGALTIRNSTIAVNFADNGGAIHGGGTRFTMSNSTVSGNTTVFQVAGLWISPSVASSLTNVTISDNTAGTFPSALLNTGTAAVTLTNCTVANNSGLGAGLDGLISLQNTIVANNAATNFTSIVTSLGNNLSTGNDSTVLNQASDLNNTNPRLAPLGNYGGPTQTRALLPGSPAINAGNNCVLTANNCGANNPPSALTSDQRGFGRVGAVDIGAVEAQTFTLAITGGNNQSTPVTTAFAVPLQVNLKEGANNLPGAVLTFTGPGGGASLNPVSSTATTDANGNASRSVTANAFAGGPYPVNATTGALSQPFMLTNLCVALTVSPVNPNLPAATAGSPYAQSFTQSGAFANSASFSVSGGSLPNGLTLNPNGTLSGTPTQTGTFNFTVKATDTLGCMGSQAYTLVVNCPTVSIAPSSLLSTLFGAPYSQTLTGTGGLAPYTFSLANGSNLPAGLTLAPNGTLSGTPIATGTTSFTISVKDANQCTGQRTYSLTVQCPTLTTNPPSLPNAVAGAAYSQTLTAAGGVGPYTLTLANGSNLPPGLTLLNGGLSGTPTTLGVYTFTVNLTDNGLSFNTTPCSGSRTYTLSVVCPPITLNPTTLANAVAGTPYTQTVTASPVGTTYNYLVTTNSLPPGLTLNPATGVISGTPLAAGNFTFVITATGWVNGQASCSGTRSYNLLVTANCPTLTLSPGSLTAAAVGASYSQTFTASGGTAPYNFAITAGTLPPGLTLASNGALSGTPTTAGTYSFTVTATAGGGCTGSQTYTLSLTCPTITLTPASLPSATAGIAYNQTVTASPAGNYLYTLATGNLPPGLSLNATTGALTGTATATGSYAFSIKAERGVGCGAVKAYTIVVNCPTVTLAPTSLPGGNVGTAYNQTLSATPAGNYSFTVSSGALPSGLTLSTAGTLSGTPTTAGTFTFTIQGRAFSNCTGTRSYTVTIAQGCPTITLPSSLPTGTVNASYFGDLSGTTPIGSYTFSLSSGALPPGLTIDNLFGALAGTPTVTGSFNFTLKATRADGCEGTRAYTLVIATPPNTVLRSTDFDGDGKSDLSVWRGNTGNWLVLRSSDAQLSSAVWGSALAPYNDLLATGDYDGDGKTDVGVYRRSDGQFYAKSSLTGGVLMAGFSAGDNLPVVGDYDGDGKSDFAIWQPTSGNWLIRQSTTGAVQTINWGSGNGAYLDVPVPGDYDGDGKTDVAVFRSTNGMWYILRSSDGGTTTRIWGAGGDVPVAGDYDNDGKADLAVWRGATGQWYVLHSADDSYKVTTWGSAAAGDVPVPGDYDSDGKLDLAVWRAAEGRWYVLNSRDSEVRTQVLGQNGDTPIAVRRP